MVIKVHGYTNIGEALTGNIDFFTITTLVPCENTGVTRPLAELKKDLAIPSASDISTVGGITVFGTSYANDNDYTDGYNKQENLNSLIQVVQQRAQPIMLNVINEGTVGNVSNVVPSGGHVSDFGTTYSGGSGTIYTIKFADEHEGAWESQDILANAIDGIDILDLTTGVISSTDKFDTSSAGLLNTIVLKNNFL